jgi:endo-alpha-1,4-polygalactosaminidase (GH114 family)
MLPLEPTRTDWSSDDTYFDTRGMVKRLTQSRAHDGTHRKLVIAYIDIEGAKDWYWNWSQEWPVGDPLLDDCPTIF